MNSHYSVTCPICTKGTFVIKSERTGDPGFRTTDYDLVSKTCNCISKFNENILYTLLDFQRSKIKADLCEDCNAALPQIHFPVKSWAGVYKDICIHCFIKEVN